MPDTTYQKKPRRSIAGLVYAAPGSAEQVTQFDRIASAIGQSNGDLPSVNKRTLHAFFQYMGRALPPAQPVYHPDRTDPSHGGFIVELIDPMCQSEDLLFSGILCRIQKGAYVLELPLIELEIPQDCPALRAIQDYRYWFWKWK